MVLVLFYYKIQSIIKYLTNAFNASHFSGRTELVLAKKCHLDIRSKERTLMICYSISVFHEDRDQVCLLTAVFPKTRP